MLIPRLRVGGRAQLRSDGRWSGLLASASDSAVVRREREKRMRMVGTVMSNRSADGLEFVRSAGRSMEQWVLWVQRRLGGLVGSESVKYLIAGAIAGVVSRTVVSPLEVVATTNMCVVGRGPMTKGLLAQLAEILRKEGIRGFFKGNGANCLKVAPTKGIQFLTFEAFKRLIYRARVRRRRRRGMSEEEATQNTPLSPWERLAAGGLAGMTAALFCYPLEVAKTLLTAHPETYRGVFPTMLRLSREKGFPSLYRGLNPTLLAMFPYVGLEFMIYEQMKLTYLRRINHDSESERHEASVLALLLIGATAGSIAQTVCHPLDVIRKRLQLQGIGGRPVLYRSMIDTAQGIYHHEGWSALYRGLQPTYMSVLPSAGVSYVVYEAIKNLLRVKSFR